MATLKHEYWLDSEGLPGLCHAGPDGDGFRKLLGEGATLVAVIEASTRYEAMSKYYQMLGRGAYDSDHPDDHKPYSEELRRRQDDLPSDK